MPRKRANGEGTMRQRSNGRWEGRYTIGIDPVTGHAVQKSVSGKTQAECRAKMQKAIEESRNLVIRSEGEYTVGEWCRQWFEIYSKPHLRPNTANGYQNILFHQIVPAIGQIKLRELTPIQIQKMYNDIKSGGRIRLTGQRDNHALSNSYVRSVHMLLHNCLQQAVRERLIHHNPCDNCRIPKKDRVEMKIIPPEQIGRYLREAERYGVLPIFYLELTSGLRRGELLALRWDDVDVATGIITVNKQVSRINGALVVSDPKTNNSIRKVAVPKRTVELLVQEHNLHPDSPYLFMSPRTGGMWSPDSVSRIHKELLAKAGMDTRVRFHDLRHTFATLAMQNGVDPKTLSGMLGHSSAAFTLDTYTHVTHQMQQAAAEKMDHFMKRVMPEPEPEPPGPTCCPGLKERDGAADNGEIGKILPFTRVG